MIDERVLQQVVAAARPSLVILFGSYGRDSADEDSDLDYKSALGMNSFRLGFGFKMKR